MGVRAQMCAPYHFFFFFSLLSLFAKVPKYDTYMIEYVCLRTTLAIPGLTIFLVRSPRLCQQYVEVMAPNTATYKRLALATPQHTRYLSRVHGT